MLLNIVGANILGAMFQNRMSKDCDFRVVLPVYRTLQQYSGVLDVHFTVIPRFQYGLLRVIEHVIYLWVTQCIVPRLGASSNRVKKMYGHSVIYNYLKIM